MIHYKLFSFVILKYFSYLCHQTNKTLNIMEKTIKSLGRTELATMYFPRMTPESAWHKLRSWLRVNPRLAHFYDLRRRTFTPAEVSLIYAELGEP